MHAEKWTTVQQKDDQQQEASYPQNSTIPHLQMLSYAWQRQPNTKQFAKFRREFISQSGLTIVWEICTNLKREMCHAEKCPSQNPPAPYAVLVVQLRSFPERPQIRLVTCRRGPRR